MSYSNKEGENSSNFHEKKKKNMNLREDNNSLEVIKNNDGSFQFLLGGGTLINFLGDPSPGFRRVVEAMVEDNSANNKDSFEYNFSSADMKTNEDKLVIEDKDHEKKDLPPEIINAMLEAISESFRRRNDDIS